MDSDRLRAILTAAGRTACAENASAFCRTHGLNSRILAATKKIPTRGGGLRKLKLILSFRFFPLSIAALTYDVNGSN